MAQSYRAERPPQVRCLLVADDLTGACDAAAQFRIQGATATVHLDLTKEAKTDDEVLALSTDSRDLPVIEVRNRLSSVGSYARSCHILFKKIDSTLRGNPGAEIAAALEAFDCEMAVITPAFPAMGRHVRDGYLHNDRDSAWQPIHVRTLLRAQGLKDFRHVPAGGVRSAFAAGYQYLSVDAAVNEDLETLVSETLRCGRRVLWAGSAGLASALARALFLGVARPSAPPAGQSAPVLFVIGSDHVVTTSQIAELSRRYSVNNVDAYSSTPESLASSLSSGRHTIITIPRNATSERLATLLCGSEHLVSALLLSGGDTASLVCHAIAAQAITLEGEIVTGLPWGILVGGSFDKRPVATKSGAFGGHSALIQVAEFFSCLAH